MASIRTRQDQEQHQEHNTHQQQQQQQQFVGPTLCISRTHKNIRQERVFAVLRQLNLGWIGKIDVVPKQVVEKNPDGTVSTKEFVRIFIHFTKWFTTNRQTQQFLERLDAEGFVHIVYDEPWFWKVTKYVARQHRSPQQSRHPKPRIDFGATAAVVQKSKDLSSSTSTTTRIVPVQVTRSLQSVSVSGGDGPQVNSKKRYWKQQAELSTAAMMSTTQNRHSASPTPRSHGSDSESSPSPLVQRNVNVRLFE